MKKKIEIGDQVGSYRLESRDEDDNITATCLVCYERDSDLWGVGSCTGTFKSFRNSAISCDCKNRTTYSQSQLELIAKRYCAKLGFTFINLQKVKQGFKSHKVTVSLCQTTGNNKNYSLGRLKTLAEKGIDQVKAGRPKGVFNEKLYQKRVNEAKYLADRRGLEILDFIKTEKLNDCRVKYVNENGKVKTPCLTSFIAHNQLSFEEKLTPLFDQLLYNKSISLA